MTTRPTAPLRVLVVEDEALLAMDIETMVSDAGHMVGAETNSLHEVEALDVTLRPDLAFVDMQLARGSNGLDVCRYIRNQWADTAIVFVTANALKVPPDECGHYGIIPKPFSRNGLMSAMRYIEQGVVDPPPKMSRPTSFIASAAIDALWSKPRS